MANKIYVIAGEASGDLHGANLIRNLQAQARGTLEIYGVGGDRIRETGARDFFDLAHFHVTGITDAVKRLPQYRRAAKVIFGNICKARPDVVVLIDNPGFNLHLARKIKTLGIPVVYYIAPQVWAWAPKRILKIKDTVRKVLVVFEFEKKIYENHGIPVVWVGHPLKDLIPDTMDRQSARKKLGFDSQSPLVALLPGSRKGELKMLVSAFLNAARLLRRRFPDASFVLLKATSLPRAYYERLLENSPVSVRLVENDGYETLKACDAALVCSGTATLECALLGTPMIITYKGTLITYLLAKRLIRVPFLGLPNLVLGEKKIPELLQFDATPEKLAEEAARLITHESIRRQMETDLKNVSKRLGEKGATRRAAVEILKVLENR